MLIAPVVLLSLSMGIQASSVYQDQQCLGGTSKSCILSPYGQSCVSTSTIKTCGGTIEVGEPIPTPIDPIPFN